MIKSEYTKKEFDEILSRISSVYLEKFCSLDIIYDKASVIKDYNHFEILSFVKALEEGKFTSTNSWFQTLKFLRNNDGILFKPEALDFYDKNKDSEDSLYNIKKEINNNIDLIFAIVILFLIVSIFSSIYVFYKNWGIFNYYVFDGIYSLWNNETLFVGKAFSIITVLPEVLLVLLISPAIIIVNFFDLYGWVSELVVAANFYICIILNYIYDHMNSLLEESSESYLNFKSQNIRSIFENNEINTKNKYCLYVGPFLDNYTSIYKNNICNSLDTIGLKVNRYNDIFSTKYVVNDVRSCINYASFIIAEISGKNPNVMYEIGISHTVGKKVILLTQNMKDVPFDLKWYRCIVYVNSKEGLIELSENILGTVKKELGIL
jgi:hypothetical protein